MKMIFSLALSLFLGFGALQAQTKSTAPATTPSKSTAAPKSQGKPATQVAPSKSTAPAAGKPSQQPAGKPNAQAGASQPKLQPVKGAEAGKTKKDGTPDRRYKENKKLKKDGTPDMRYKQNKSAAPKTATKPAAAPASKQK